MKKFAFLSFFIFQGIIAQERDELLKGLFEEEMTIEEQLLPKKMIFTHSVYW